MIRLYKNVNVVLVTSITYTLAMSLFNLRTISYDTDWSGSTGTTFWDQFDIDCDKYKWPMNMLARFMLDRFNGRMHGNKTCSSQQQLVFKGLVTSEDILDALIDFEDLPYSSLM